MVKMFKLLSVLFVSIILGSCAHMIRSGQYIEWTAQDTLESVASEFKTSASAIEAHNVGRTFSAGQRIFVPTTAGIMGPKLARGLASKKHYSTEDFMNSGDFLWPVPSASRISSEFGPRWGRHHDGIDIPARSGAHIVAAQDGVVVHSGTMNGYGNIIVISHPKGLFTVYAHNKKNMVRASQVVHRGQVIGQVGSTGRSSGPHLHFEVRHDSRALDPKRLVVRN
jgi:murein DD-endopeptidase MepM/ murein hydrolase activator NlpD